ncbi:hypothetical protein Y882_15765 [Dyella japonica DSM 16301]|uniref:AlpA family transcriptional regulator n=2 Tax=Dyella japonica TaxID=231455 RepID=A0A0G9H466_9GAMM|nr:hypothetical protein Y882_15765 [Dyella japonica DSM 16301]
MMIEIPANTKFVRLHTVMKMVGLSRSQIYKLVSEGRFPPQIKLSTRSVAWVEADVLSWMYGRIAPRLAA